MDAGQMMLSVSKEIHRNYQALKQRYNRHIIFFKTRKKQFQAALTFWLSLLTFALSLNHV